MLDLLGSDLWVAEGGNVSFFGFAYPTRMAVVRLTSGDLWVWSPITLDTALEAEVRALGPVRHLVSPNKLHHLFLAAWHDRFPEAKLWGTASTIARFPQLGFVGELTDAAPPEWVGQIDQYHFTNSPFLDEIAFFHRASRTAILADLSQPFCQAFLKRHWPLWLRTVARLAGLTADRGHPPPELRFSFRHRAEGRAKVRAIIDSRPDHVVVAHGEITRSGGADYLRRAFDWLL